eukprot:2561558-Prymnesium_polylepis.1
MYLDLSPAHAHSSAYGHMVGGSGWEGCIAGSTPVGAIDLNMARQSQARRSACAPSASLQALQWPPHSELRAG